MFNEVTKLRKAGELKEALELALQNYKADPENIWNKRGISWVYYELLKKSKEAENYDLFKEYLFKIKELNLPENEDILFESCAWQIGSFIFALQKSKQVDYSKISEIFEIIKYFNFPKPSECYTFLYKAFHKGYKNWDKYLIFADWWDFKNFREVDYEKEIINNKQVMSTVEQAYIAYSKKLLDVVTTSTFESREKSIEKIKEFLPKIETINETHPEYQYPPYYIANFLLKMGDKKKGLSKFLPFAKKKKNDFWIWELLAEVFDGDDNKQFICYCRALSLNTPEIFLGKLKIKFAEFILKKNMYAEAKTEIKKVLHIYEKYGWRIPNKIKQWQNEDWYHVTNSKSSNIDLYSKYISMSDEILFLDTPEEIIAVEYINEKKKIINFIKNKDKHGFFKYDNQIRLNAGDIIKVRFKDNGDNNYFSIYTLRKINSNKGSEAIRDFEGKLRLTSKGFGFIEDIFIDSKTIEKFNLLNDKVYIGKAILSFNKKKNEWGWKAILFH